MWLPILGLILGLAVGYISPFVVPVIYAKYLSVGILAALDSVLGGIRAAQEETFDAQVFLTGFFSNMLLAASFAYIGDRIGVDLYLAAVVVFGARLFQNLAVIRRHLMKK
ncbi:MAG: small basic family protein [Peptococcaceae bacterium]|nr:small basic family protein [Peptococcaceae bacterium]